MASFEIRYEDDTLRQAVARNVHVAAWFDAPTLEQMHEYGRCARGVYRSYRGKSALLNLVVEGVPRFSSEVRKAAADYTAEGLHQLGAAHVILVGGLLGASVRGFLGTMLLVGRPPNPAKVFGDLPSAAAWQAKNLAPFEEEPWTAQEIVTICESLIARE
jgi:hypothetical protein